MDSRERAEVLFFEGNRLSAKGLSAQAEQCWREAISLLPDFAEAHANLAWLLDQCGLRRAAEKHYRQALTCHPDDGQTQLNFAVMLAGQKRFEAAQAAYRAALALLPESAAAWSNLGVLQACMKQEDDAERSYRRAIALDPDLIMYDEPFAGLDPISLGTAAQLIRELNNAMGLTTVIVSHDLEETFRLADHVIILGPGTVAAQGTPDEVRASQDPLVHQFVHALPTGPVPFHYPGPSVAQDFGPVGAQQQGGGMS